MSELTRFRLSELYEISSGISSKPEQAGHGYPFCSFSTVFNNPILPDKLPDLMDTSDEERVTYSIKAGDVFITRTSETVDELGMSSVAVKDYPNATYSGFLKRLRPISNKTYPKYMALFFRSKYFRKTMTNKAVMTLRASFNEDIFNDIFVDLPTIDEQTRIGDLYYKIECYIRNNNTIRTDLEAMTKLLYDYWFVQFDFPDENGNPYKSSGGKMVWNEELKREIPDGWNVKTVMSLSHLFVDKREAGFGKKSGPYRFYSCSKDVQYCDEYDYDGKSIIVSNHGEFRVEHIDGKFSAYFCNAIFQPVNDNHYGLLFLTLNKYIPLLQRQAGGSIVKFISNTDIGNVPILVPNNDFYSNIFNMLLKKLEVLIEENQQLASLCDFLLPMLMNGQVKVKT